MRATACTIAVIAALLPGVPLTAAVADDVPEPDFNAVGVSFLKDHCVGCHSGDEPSAELALDVFTDTAAVVKQRKLSEKVLRLVEAGEMPPADEPRPLPADVTAFVGQVKAIFAYAERHAEPDPGRVTMRRLNRREYRNTVRDLIGIDFDPTEDFPSDDIGHGFDNIGDVLTLPPVLMERYLAAAESIVQRAILPNPPSPPKRMLSTRYSEPAGRDVPMEGSFRRLASDAGDSPILSGPIHTPYKWVEDGEYIFRTRVYAEATGEAAVQVAVLVTGKDLVDGASDEAAAPLSGAAVGALRPFRILGTFEVHAKSAYKAEVFEVAVPEIPGRHRMAVALVNPPQGQPPVKLYVEYLALEGPLDTRPSSHRKLLTHATDVSHAEATREVVERFLLRAYRRKPTVAETQRLIDFVKVAESDGNSWEEAMQLAVQAVLCSPKFLFRVELDDRPENPQPRSLDEYQLASRLSYFLWSTMPDDTLLELAGNGQLSNQLDAQVKRMLADPKAMELVDSFALQWLQLERLVSLAPDAKRFPRFNESVRDAMLEETRRFFAAIITEDRSILELIDADFTFLNEPLAQLYGITDTQGNLAGQPDPRPGGEKIRGRDFVRVDLSANSQRGGLLTQASVLTVTSNPTRTSLVKRGRWVLEQILGAPPPPPPPDVPELPSDAQAEQSGSLRKRLEVHRQNPSCASCHAKMDPLGFALENYDAVGAFRTKDGAFEIDPSGELPDGKKFENLGELKQILKDREDEVARCLVEKMLIFALGRGLEYYDRPVVSRIIRQLADDEYRFSAVVREIVTSEPFRMRRGFAE